jgi:hypothetical protein
MISSKSRRYNTDLSKKPSIAEHLNKVEFIKAVAKWRHETKTKLLELTQPKEGEEWKS